VSHAKNQYDDAIEEFEIAIKLDPQEPKAYSGLGQSYQAKSRLDDAITFYNKAIAIDPNFANAYNHLGLALQAKKQLDAAIGAFQTAIKIEPKFVLVHNNLGLVFRDKKQFDEAIAKFEDALKIDPNCAPAYNNLGQVMLDKNQLDDAIKEFQKAIQLDPDFERAYAGCGWALFRNGQFNQGRLMIEKALSLISATDELRPRLLVMRDQCALLGTWEAKLLDVLAGKAQPKDNIERISMITICSLQKRYAAAAKLYTAAFAADKKLAEDRHSRHRFAAAEHAARAAAGLGIDGDKLNAEEKTKLRKLALEWLRGDLDQNARLLEGAQASVTFAIWTDVDRWPKSLAFASIRDKEWLDKYPEDEQKLCREFWADVERLLQRIKPKKEVSSSTRHWEASVVPSL
jgi:Tfp pilus assembly protein PilF